jgi:hypothetical protein
MVSILRPSFLEILGLETLLHGMAAYMHNLYKVLMKVKSMQTWAEKYHKTVSNELSFNASAKLIYLYLRLKGKL